MSNDTVVYTGHAWPVQDNQHMSVHWAEPIEGGLAKVRGKFVTMRSSDCVIFRSTRSGALHCCPTKDWVKCGGQIPAAA